MSLVKDEVELIVKTVSACAAQQEDQLAGRKFINELTDFILPMVRSGKIPMYTVVTSLWVMLYTLSEEWEAEN